MWENLAIQIPIVAAFVWFVLEMDKRNAAYAHQRDTQWREFLSSQNEINQAAWENNTRVLQRVADKLDEHDKVMREAVVRMEATTQAKLIKPKTERKNRNL